MGYKIRIKGRVMQYANGKDVIFSSRVEAISYWRYMWSWIGLPTVVLTREAS